MRAAKLAMARKMLKEHQEKKQASDEKSDNSSPKTFDYLLDVSESDYIINPDNESEKSASIITPPEREVELPQNNDIQNTIVNDTTAYDYKIKYEEQLKAVEFLTTNKRHLEIQVQDLQNRINQIESNNSDSLSNHNSYKHELSSLQAELNSVKENNLSLKKELAAKNNTLDEQLKSLRTLMDKNTDLLEELDMTKTALVARENECTSFQSYIRNLQSQLESTELRMQQLTNGQSEKSSQDTSSGNIEDIDILLQKLNTLEQQLKAMMTEKEKTRVRFEQYVKELNDNLNYVSMQNGDLVRQNHALCDRETCLVGQLSQMEIRMQKLMREHELCSNLPPKVSREEEITELKQKCKQLEASLKEVQKKYENSVAEVEALKKIQEEKISCDAPVECTHVVQDINVTKLQADIASDKIAAQMATAQNVQLKDEIQHLKEVFDKMSQDKLELTEKLDAEKFLNRQLTLKLSEIDEKAKENHSKLMAKDKEMIRLISSYNEIEQRMNEQTSKMNAIQNDSSMINHNINCVNKQGEEESNEHEYMPLINTHDESNVNEEHSNALNISIKDGMFRLQDSFLKKMNELAELSDEKQRLEHIIMQLQSETDTICEYVALYQQQRGILKERERERKMQLKFLEAERKRMKSQLDILRDIISKFASDETLKEYFKKDQRQKDVSEIMNLLANLNKSYLIDETKQLSEIHLYHCSWCSGKVIDV